MRTEPISLARMACSFLKKRALSILCKYAVHCPQLTMPLPLLAALRLLPDDPPPQRKAVHFRGAIINPERTHIAEDAFNNGIAGEA